MPLNRTPETSRTASQVQPSAEPSMSPDDDLATLPPPPIFYSEPMESLGACSTSVDVETDSSTESTQSLWLREQERLFAEKHTQPFLQFLSLDDFEYGYTSTAERYLRSLLQENRLLARNWLSQLFTSLFAQQDSRYVDRILRVIQNLDYQELDHQGVLIAMAATRHRDILIREGAIRAFESWPTLETLRLLESFHCDEPWLRRYVDQVIADIGEELQSHAMARSKD